MAARRAERRALDPHRGRDHRPPRRGRSADGRDAEPVAAVVRGRGRARPRPARRALEERLGEVAAVARRAAGRARRRDDRRRRQAAAPAAGLPGRRRRGGRRASCAPRPRSSWSTRRRSSTTTCSTPPRCAAAGRPWSPPAGAAPPPPPATCSSRARSPSWPPTGAPTRSASLSEASSALAEGELLQRADAWNAERVARALPAPLRAQDRAPVRGRVPARRAGGRRRRPSELGAFGRRIGLAFQLLDDVLDVSGPGGAHRQAARHRPARRHGDAAADPRPRARPGAGRARPARDRLRRAWPRTSATAIAATGALDEAARPRAGDGRRGQGRAAGRAAGAPAPRARARGRRASSTATPSLRPAGG